MRLKLIAAAVLGAAITAPACAMAGQVIQNQTIPTQTVVFSYPFTLNPFNTALGTLESVEFILTDTSTAQVLVYNDTGSTQGFTNASSSVPLTVSGAGHSITDTVTANVPSGSVLSGQTNTYSGLTNTNTVSNTFMTGLGAFETAPVLLSFEADGASGTYGGTAASDVFFSGSANAGGTFELIYNYASVPEPGTWAFLMLGVGAIGVAMRRRKDGLALAAA